MIRAILDTNIWISFLLGSKKQGTIAQIVTAVFGHNIELIVPQELIAELYSVVDNSPYVSTRIRKSNFDALIERLYELAVVVPICRNKADLCAIPKMIT